MSTRKKRNNQVSEKCRSSNEPCRSEVLNYSGAFDKLSEESRDKIDDVKKGALKMVNKYRSQIRRRLKPEGIRNAIQAAATKEKAAAAGAATGVFLGLTM